MADDGFSDLGCGFGGGSSPSGSGFGFGSGGFTNPASPLMYGGVCDDDGETRVSGRCAPAESDCPESSCCRRAPSRISDAFNAIMLVIGFIIMAAIAFMVLRFVLTMLYLFLFR